MSDGENKPAALAKQLRLIANTNYLFKTEREALIEAARELEKIASYNQPITQTLPIPPAHPKTTTTCWCETCDRANNWLRFRMNICPDCGDKRCPKAAYHGNKCQKEAAPAPEREA